MSNFHICPSGTILPFAGNTAPSGWLLCDGSSKLRAEYKNLYDAIGTAWGPGDSPNNTFNLPDFRGLFFRGLDVDVAGFANRDPEKDTRVSLQGTAVGNKVGSYQAGAMGTHDHGSSSSSTPTTITHGHGINYVTTGNHSHTANGSGHGDSHFHSVTVPFRADYTRANRRDPANLWERSKIVIQTSTAEGGHSHSLNFGWGGYGWNIDGHGHTALDTQSVSHPHSNDNTNSGAENTASSSSLDIYPSNAYVNFIIKM